MALVDARRGGIDDDKHLRSEVLAAAIENDAGHADGGGVLRPFLHVEVQRREAVLAVDDQALGGRLRQVPRAVAIGAEIQLLAGVQQHRAGDRRLRHRGFIEIGELAHLGARQAALEGAIRTLDLGDELGDIVVLRDARRRDLLALAVETADETHLRKQVLRPVRSEVEDPVLLANLCCVHRLSPGLCAGPPAGAAGQKYTRFSPDRRGASGPGGPRRWRGFARKRPHPSAAGRPWAAGAVRGVPRA